MEGGESTLWEARQLFTGQDDRLTQQFIDQVDASYRDIMQALDAPEPDLAALSKRYQQAQRQDYFNPAGQPPPDGFEAFDIPGERPSHRGGHCTFHAMLREYDLDDPVLQRLAQIIYEADVVHEVLVEPVAAGLDTLCRGVRRISPDDRTAVEHGRLSYAALNAELAADQP